MEEEVASKEITLEELVQSHLQEELFDIIFWVFKS